MTKSQEAVSRFERWRAGISADLDSKWDAYDCDIMSAVSIYNGHLQGTAGFHPLDWLLIKAMMWVESGAANPQWFRKPIQIGNPGDPGLQALLGGREGGDLILPPAFRNTLNRASILTIPQENIKAGIGYLLMKMANFAIRNVPDLDRTIYEVTVRAGDSFDRIARERGSTVETMRELNPTALILRPGQVLKYRKASLRKVIVGWKVINTSSIAQNYNGGGDSIYQRKLEYVLPLLRQRRASSCPR